MEEGRCLDVGREGGGLPRPPSKSASAVASYSVFLKIVVKACCLVLGFSLLH